MKYGLFLTVVLTIVSAAFISATPEHRPGVLTKLDTVNDATFDNVAATLEPDQDLLIYLYIMHCPAYVYLFANFLFLVLRNGVALVSHSKKKSPISFKTMSTDS